MAWKIYALLTQILNGVAIVGGFLLGLGDPNLILVGELLIALALGGQVAADYLKKQGIIEYHGFSLSIYSLLKLVFTIFAAVGAAVIESGVDENLVIVAYLLIAVSIGGNVAIDYLREKGVISTPHRR